MGTADATFQQLVSAGALTSAGQFTTFNVSNSPASPNDYASAPVLTAGANLSTNNSAAWAFDNDRFFSFSLTVTSPDALDFTNISFDAARVANSSRRFAVRVIDPNNIAQPIVTDVDPGSGAVRPNFANFSYDLSGISSLQNVAIGQTITFQIAIYDSNATRTIDFDNITVTAIPEPTTYAAIFGLLVLGFALVRRTRNR
ncbi:MAG: PEP-CTERM sorting domain-containing protein [Verrucomicrobia bacterium]|nr:PEP-CTERM sorting domain-containing protein [Verrucomicrobiota bacterium]